MRGTVLVTCLDNSFAEKLAEVFAREKYYVFAIGDKPIKDVTLLPSESSSAAEILREKAGKLDFLLETVDFCDPEDIFTINDGINVAVIEKTYRQNVIRPMAVLEAFLPLMDKDGDKRLFYVTSAQTSINETQRANHFGYNMSKAALHQFIQMTRNKLAPKGFTFRVFDPMASEVSADLAAESAYNYIIRRRGTENHDPLRDDEENLLLRDAQGRQHSW